MLYALELGLFDPLGLRCQFDAKKKMIHLNGLEDAACRGYKPSVTPDRGFQTSMPHPQMTTVCGMLSKVSI